MARIVSLILDNFKLLECEFSGLSVNGANITSGGFVGRLARDPKVDVLEIFLPPAYIVQQDQLSRIAMNLLPPENVGLGRLRFYPLHALPEVWSDGLPRILHCFDPERLARERYLRDRFAVGPTPITCDTHALAHYQQSHFMDRFARASRVTFDSIVNISEACRAGMHNTLCGQLGSKESQPPCRLDLIYRGVDTERFQPASLDQKLEARRALDLPKEGCIALYFGRLSPKSKADLRPLVRLFQQIENDNAYLLMAGLDEVPGYVELLNELAGTLGIQDRLIIHPDVPPGIQYQYYAAADFFVFPGDTIQEALGTAVLEAMSTGLPTLVSHWDGMRELVTEGVTGFRIPTWMMPIPERIAAMSPFTPWDTEYLLTGQSVWVDTDVLEQRMSFLYQSVSVRYTMGNAARQSVLDKYSEQINIIQWHALWDELEEIAGQETPEEAEIRKAGAIALAMPTPYNFLVSHYPTHVIDPMSSQVMLTKYGKAVVRGETTLSFYDETLPLIHPDVINGIYEYFTEQSEIARITDLTKSVHALTGVLEDDIRYHVALLLKRDVIILVK